MPENPKPYDQAFKAMPEASPRGFAEVMGILAPGTDAEVELLPSEVSLATKAIDAGLLIRPRGGAAFIAIFEAFGKFRRRSLDQVIEYNKALDGMRGLPMQTYLVPLVPRAIPARPPELVRRERGDYAVEIRLRWIKPWEIDASLLFAQGSPAFLALMPLFRSTEQQQIAAVLQLRENRDQLARYRILGGLRYRGRETPFWTAFVERMNRMLLREDLRESLAVQEWLAEGRAEGLVEGRTEGRAEGRVEGRVEGLVEGRVEGRHQADEDWLRLTLATRFPGLAVPEHLPTGVDFAELGRRLMLAPSERAARTLLRRHKLIA